MAKVVKSRDEWQQILSAEEFEITRNAATEPPFSGLYCDTKTAGMYNCKCCDQPLFDSATKYDSGCGWPSFYASINPEVVNTTEDTSMGMRRIEVTCANCDAHLGHVFPDGPEPTGMRFCMNSASLQLDVEE